MSNEDIAVRFGKRLRELRRNRGWTQVQMADALGVDRSYISDMEQGKKNICLPTLEVMAQGFGITMSQMITQKPDITGSLEPCESRRPAR